MADLAEEAQRYGWNLAVFQSSGELMALLKKAIKESWTQQNFISHVQGSKWFRTRPESARQAIALRASDPQEYRRRVQQSVAHIRTVYTQMAGGAGMSGKWLTAAAEQALMLGWTDEEVRSNIARDIGYRTLMSRDQLGGEAGALEEQIQKWGGDYGVKLSDRWVASRLKEAMMGTSDQTAVLQTLQKIAKSQYRAFADDIDRGATVADIAEPYRQSMAKVLELNPNSIDVFDGSIQRALTWTDPDKGKPNPKAVWQFENELRNDARWTKTDNARESLMGIGHDILKQMGVAV